MTIDPAAAQRATDAVPSIPRDTEGPVFREPWEAQAFAMALALHERGLFTWPEWAATLADEIKRAQAPAIPTPARPITGTGSTRSNASSPRRASPDPATLARYRDAWDHAADRTPHGEPIELRPEDFPSR